jgi:hypothetical protein
MPEQFWPTKPVPEQLHWYAPGVAEHVPLF